MFELADAAPAKATRRPPRAAALSILYFMFVTQYALKCAHPIRSIPDAFS
jgi:hypothetical protein